MPKLNRASIRTNLEYYCTKSTETAPPYDYQGNSCSLTKSRRGPFYLPILSILFTSAAFELFQATGTSPVFCLNWVFSFMLQDVFRFPASYSPLPLAQPYSFAALYGPIWGYSQ